MALKIIFVVSIVFLANCAIDSNFVRIDRGKEHTVRLVNSKILLRVQPRFPKRVTEPENSEQINAKCSFFSIPGNFSGPAVGPDIYEFQVTGNRVNLDLSDTRFADKLRISELRTNIPETKIDLSVTPVNAKFARAGTFCENFGSGFMSETGQSLILVYAEQEMTVRGKMSQGGYVAEFDLRIPGSGFYFVDLGIETPEGHPFASRVYEANDVRLVLSPN